MKTAYLKWMVWFMCQIYLPAKIVNGQCSKDIVLTDQLQGKVLVNHTFQTESAIDHDECQFLCFLENRCISYSFDGQMRVCNLSESDHIMHWADMVDAGPTAVYYRVKNDCGRCSGQNTVSCTYNHHKGHHQCNCKPGFSGTKCETDINECSSSPCKNNGTCTDLVNGYNCSCTDNFTGQDCSINRVSWLHVTPKPIRVGSKDEQFGSFTIPKPCTIYRFKLVHVSGPGLAHNGFETPENWGFKDLIMMYITNDSTRDVISPLNNQVDSIDTNLGGYRINGVKSNAPDLVLPTLSPSLTVSAGKKFRVWYGQDLNNYAEKNNVGYVMINVMALVRV